MWQRFTERARRVVFSAQEEAGRMGEMYVSTEHLLLGLIREKDSFAVRTLARLNVSLDLVRKEVESQSKQGDVNATGKDMMLSPRAKRVIDLAYDESRQMGSNFIGTEHLLLGLIREADDLAGRVLTGLGVELDRARSEVILLQDQRPGLDNPPEAIQQQAYQIHGRIAEKQAEYIEQPLMFRIQPGDLGVVKAPEGRAQIEVALDAPSFVRLAEIFTARDGHGYRAMAHGDQTMFLIPNGAPLKCLVPSAGSEAATKAGGLYVRVLSGEYEGYAGWIFASAFERTGPDKAPFPPELDH